MTRGFFSCMDPSKSQFLEESVWAGAGINLKWLVAWICLLGDFFTDSDPMGVSNHHVWSGWKIFLRIEQS